MYIFAGQRTTLPLIPCSLLGSLMMLSVRTLLLCSLFYNYNFREKYVYIRWAEHNYDPPKTGLLFKQGKGWILRDLKG